MATDGYAFTTFVEHGRPMRRCVAHLSWSDVQAGSRDCEDWLSSAATLLLEIERPRESAILSCRNVQRCVASQTGLTHNP